jgi:hypothetical protein
MTNKKRLMVKNFSGVLILLFSALIGSCSSLGETVSPDWPDLKISHDEFRNISFVQSVTLNGGFSSSPLELYIGINESGKILRFRATYNGNGWIFFDNAILINDQGGNIQYTFDRSQLDRDVISGGNVRESVDIAFSTFVNADGELAQLAAKVGEDTTASLGIGKHSDPEKIKNLLELLNGTNVRLRLSGDKYQEYKISDVHLVALKNVIGYYESITVKIE